MFYALVDGEGDANTGKKEHKRNDAENQAEATAAFGWWLCAIHPSWLGLGSYGGIASLLLVRWSIVILLWRRGRRIRI